MTLVPADVAAILEREWASTLVLLENRDHAEWQRATRCAGWTVLDLGRHVAWGVSMEADSVRRGRAGVPETAVGRTVAADAAPADVLAEVRAAVGTLVDEVMACDVGDEAVTLPMPHGDTPLPVALDIFVFEAGIHAGDFADAFGQDRPLAADVVPATARVTAAFLPMFAIAGTAAAPPGATFSVQGDAIRIEGRWTADALVMGALDEEPTVTVSGDDSSVLLFAVGRLGVDDPRLEVTGAQELARDFKRFVPGP